MKTCSTCHETKPLDQFMDHKRYVGGKDSACYACMRSYRIRLRRKQGIRPKPTFLERIWDNIAVCEHGEDCIYCCWPWKNSRQRIGYGSFTFRNALGTQRHTNVTRVVYELFHTIPIPEGLNALHYCDFPPCCNPAHLWLGTIAQNNQDAAKKGRTSQGINHHKNLHPENVLRGEKHKMAKRSDSDVLTIRALHAKGITGVALSKQFDLTQTQISRIVRRKSRTDI
jgi:hypothetical protein